MRFGPPARPAVPAVRNRPPPPQAADRAPSGRARLGPGAVLLDVANLAWRDPALPRIDALPGLGVRAPVVVLLRRHAARAASMIAFRRSSVLPWRLAGARRLERAVLADMLTPAALERILALDADVLTVGFEALTRDTACVLDCNTRICGTPPIAAPGAENPSVAARSAAAAAAGRGGSHLALIAYADVRLKNTDPCQKQCWSRSIAARNGIERERRSGGRRAGHDGRGSAS